jgi:hypothetical protein
MARDGSLLQRSHAAQPVGGRRAQGRATVAAQASSRNVGRQVEAAARRQARIVELGFTDERSYLHTRYITLGWTVTRVAREWRTHTDYVLAAMRSHYASRPTGR